MFLDDLALVLEQAGIATRSAGQIIATAGADDPDTDDPIVKLRESQGFAGIRNQNQKRAAYEKPGAVVVVTARDYDVAMRVAKHCSNAYADIENDIVDQTVYLSIAPQQEPFGMGLNRQSRHRIGFNVVATKRPS